ncbi:CopG family transcriptional regulator [Clostridioides difficile]|uniref:CopG family transcriptional regulator n=1 Tax=Clostridioides difficile TaxID=1496 RepID=UPI00093AC124|nr:CopG family transcriptional regulator [Clostridioides difficile]MBY0108634.1 CopG family transcriptional regulator [Clostridioides difficile]MBY2130648.1 CopG family transcriptional regulator [Clostridioides difficile]MBY2242486.1 CopG family transcriptional regulator [Clostridioides difficile]MBZ0619934.1 CopG family transcriptional regulator [Clostridioides difficile]MBZ1159780.1 CopG family transcriptional regulator [Clostridioides difficile]
MSSKMGRPKVDNPKNIDVKVRFDENTHKKLLDYCEKENITRTEAIRKGVDLLLEEDK